MAAYATVSWKNNDEVTSNKLDQMAQNEQWLKDNIIIGDCSFPAGADGVAGGRRSGAFAINKMQAVEVRFDSTTKVGWYDFSVPIPPVFKEPPVGVFSIADSNGDSQPTNGLIGYWLDDTKTKTWQFRVIDFKANVRRMRGTLHAIFVGR